jgi:low temperature requirement protein LtrA
MADELVLAHPGGHIEAKTALAVLGGPTLYLLGNALFKRTS